MKKMQEFVKAVVAYQKRLSSLTSIKKPLMLNKEMENKRKVIVRSFSHAKDLYNAGRGMNSTKDSELEAGAEFLEVHSYTNIPFLYDFNYAILLDSDPFYSAKKKFA